MEYEMHPFYQRIDVQFELIMNMRYREICFIRNEDKLVLRGYNIFNRNGLNYIFNKERINPEYGVYRSIYPLAFNKQSGREYVKQHFGELKNGFLPDLIFDFDAKEYSKAQKDTILLTSWLDSDKIPYWTQTTAGKGLHVVIDGNDLSREDFPPEQRLFKATDDLAEGEENVSLYSRIREKLNEHLSIKCDLGAGAWDRSVYRMPYSLRYSDGKIRVVLPLDRNQLYWDVKKFQWENVVDTVNLYKRGLLKREHPKENTKKLKDFL